MNNAIMEAKGEEEEEVVVVVVEPLREVAGSYVEEEDVSHF